MKLTLFLTEPVPVLTYALPPVSVFLSSHHNKASCAN